MDHKQTSYRTYRRKLEILKAILVVFLCLLKLLLLVMKLRLILG